MSVHFYRIMQIKTLIRLLSKRRRWVAGVGIDLSTISKVWDGNACETTFLMQAIGTDDTFGKRSICS
jgi:hypothetical protein